MPASLFEKEYIYYIVTIISSAKQRARLDKKFSVKIIYGESRRLFFDEDYLAVVFHGVIHAVFGEDRGLDADDFAELLLEILDSDGLFLLRVRSEMTREPGRELLRPKARSEEEQYQWKDITPTSDKACGRKKRAPKGLRRRKPVCFVVPPRRIF
jgi:hypothetical protein